MLNILIMTLALLAAQVDHPVVITHLESIDYPPVARDAQIQGRVDVQVELSDEGEVVSAVASSGHPILKHAAEKNIQRWRFAVGSARKFAISYDFSLEEPRTAWRPDTKDYFDLPSHVRVVSTLPARTD